MTTQSEKISLKWIYIPFAVLVLAILIWTTLQTLRENPTREISIELPDQGWITLSLTTNPFPSLATGVVKVDLRISNSRGVMIDLGETLPYSFGAKGSEEIFGSGEALLDGSSYQAGVIFPAPGKYWLIFDLGGENQAEFQLVVKPAQ